MAKADLEMGQFAKPVKDRGSLRAGLLDSYRTAPALRLP